MKLWSVFLVQAYLRVCGVDRDLIFQLATIILDFFIVMCTSQGAVVRYNNNILSEKRLSKITINTTLIVCLKKKLYPLCR